MDSLDLVVRAHELAMSDAKYVLDNFKQMEKEQKWGCYSCANFLGNQSMFLCEHCVDRSNWRKADET